MKTESVETGSVCYLFDYGEVGGSTNPVVAVGVGDGLGVAIGTAVGTAVGTGVTVSGTAVEGTLVAPGVGVTSTRQVQISP